MFPCVKLYTHCHDETYYIHSRVVHGIFSTRPTQTTSNVHGYPTATNIIMGTLRPVGNYIVRQQHHMPRVKILTSNFHADRWEVELMQHHQEMTDVPTIKGHLRNGNIVSCSDGSVQNGIGSFGFIVSTAQGQRLIRGRGPTPGAYPNSFRSKAY